MINIISVMIGTIMGYLIAFMFGLCLVCNKSVMKWFVTRTYIITEEIAKEINNEEF